MQLCSLTMMISYNNRKIIGKNISKYLETKQHTSNSPPTKDKASNEIKNIKLNETENIIFQYIWDIDEQVLRRIFIVLTVYTGKEKMYLKLVVQDPIKRPLKRIAK